MADIPEKHVEAVAKAMFAESVRQARKEFDRLGVGLQDAEDFFTGLRAESDAALVILATSYVDAHLTDAWKRNIPGKSASLYEALFDNSGPLATMSAKIRLANGLSWLLDSTAADLHTLRKIRNKFAHDPYKQTISAPEILALVESLSHGEKVVIEAAREIELVELTPRLKFHVRTAFICFHTAMELLAAPIAALHRVPIGAVIGSYDNGPAVRREFAKTMARLALKLLERTAIGS